MGLKLYFTYLGKSTDNVFALFAGQPARRVFCVNLYRG